MRGVAAVGLAAAGLGWALEPHVFASAWLAGFAVWLGWPLGSLALLLVHRLTGGAWGAALMPGLLSGVGGLWLLVPAAVPLLLVLPALYPWVGHGAGGYLALPAFAVRGVVYLVVWLGLGGLVLRAGQRGGVSGALAGWGLVVLALTMNFAAIDLTMSLTPGYASSAYGLVAIAGAVLLALAVAILPGRGAGGGLLLGAALLWGYLDFMQFLITAESDLASDAPWYVQRLAGGWLVVAMAVSALTVVVPVLTLMSRRLRRSPAVLTGLAALVVVGLVLRGWWVVLPTVPRGLSWIDFACLLAFAGCSLALPRARVAAVPFG